MKRFTTALTLLVIMLIPNLALVGNAAAYDIFSNPDSDYQCGQDSANGTPDVCTAVNSQSTTDNPIIEIIKAAINIISYVIGAAAIIVILISTIRMITSGGDAQAAGSARSGIAYALIGIAIAILAQVLVVFVLNKVK